MRDRINHYVMWNSEGSVIHEQYDCPHVPDSASMGAAYTRLEAACATSTPLCRCAHSTQSLRDAALVLRDYGTDADSLIPDDLGCLICKAQWVRGHDGTETLAHAELCVVPVLVWIDGEVYPYALDSAHVRFVESA